MKLHLICNEFGNIKINGVRKFAQYCATNGYDHNSLQSKNSISFRLNDSSIINEVVEKIKKQFALNPDLDVNNYVKLKTTFADYETDKTPIISILFDNGARGWTNPPEINLENE